MSTRLRVKGYQAARDVDIEIEGLTVLKGDSNAGKSSVLKALYSATHNRFRSGCVTWGERACVVMLRYDGEENMLRVERSASGGSPSVRLGHGKDWLQFDKLGRDVPQEVQSYNNFGFIQVSPSERLSLNFCTQFALPLMVRFSNKRIVDILSYSKATKEAQGAKRWIDERNLVLKGEFNAMDSALTHTKEYVSSLQSRMSLYDTLPAMEACVRTIGSLEESLVLYASLLEYKSKRAAIVACGRAGTRILKAARAACESEVYLAKFRMLVGVALRIRKVTELYRSAADLCDRLRDELPLYETIEGLGKLAVLYGRRDALRRLVLLAENSLKSASLVSGGADARIRSLERLCGLLRQRPVLEESLSQAEYNFKHMVCPVCGAPITVD